MKLDVQPYTFGMQLNKRLPSISAAINGISPFLTLLAIMGGYLVTRDETFAFLAKVQAAVYVALVLAALIRIGYTFIRPRYGMSEGDILKWMEASQLLTAFPERTLKVRTIMPNVPYFTPKTVLWAVLLALFAPLSVLTLSDDEGVCNTWSLTITVTQPSVPDANFVFGHELGHIVQTLFKKYSDSTVPSDLVAHLPKMWHYGKPELLTDKAVEDELLYLEWEADLYAIYFGITALGLSADDIARQVKALRQSIWCYSGEYHLSMVYAEVLKDSAYVLSQSKSTFTWEAFMHVVYSQIPEKELECWKEVVRNFVAKRKSICHLTKQGILLYKEKRST